MKFFKRYLVLFLILTMAGAGPVWAQEMITANQVTVAWDPVEPIAAGDSITYNVYTRFVNSADPIGDPVNVSATQATITFQTEGSYYIGIATQRELSSGEIEESDINWSNVNEPEGSTPIPFGVLYLVKPSWPMNLHRP